MRISTLSDKPVLLMSHNKRLGTVYIVFFLFICCVIFILLYSAFNNCDFNESQVLNDYLHVYENHDIVEIYNILSDFECKCRAYSRGQRRNTRKAHILNDEYLIRLTGTTIVIYIIICVEEYKKQRIK